MGSWHVSGTDCLFPGSPVTVMLFIWDSWEKWLEGLAYQVTHANRLLKKQWTFSLPVGVPQLLASWALLKILSLESTLVYVRDKNDVHTEWSSYFQAVLSVISGLPLWRTFSHHSHFCNYGLTPAICITWLDSSTLHWQHANSCKLSWELLSDRGNVFTLAALWKFHSESWIMQ